MLVNANNAEFEPAVEAVTLYEPARPLAVAFVLACPPAIVTLAVVVPPVKIAAAPEAGDVKRTIPPLTGSLPTPAIAATSGEPKLLRIVALCGEPANTEMVKPRDSTA